MQLGLFALLIGGFNDLCSLGQAIQTLARPPELAVGLGELREYPWHQ